VAAALEVSNLGMGHDLGFIRDAPGPESAVSDSSPLDVLHQIPRIPIYRIQALGRHFPPSPITLGCSVPGFSVSGSRLYCKQLSKNEISILELPSFGIVGFGIQFLDFCGFNYSFPFSTSSSASFCFPNLKNKSSILTIIQINISIRVLAFRVFKI
jgi:hypothetical protein